MLTSCCSTVYTSVSYDIHYYVSNSLRLWCNACTLYISQMQVMTIKKKTTTLSTAFVTINWHKEIENKQQTAKQKKKSTSKLNFISDWLFNDAVKTCSTQMNWKRNWLRIMFERGQYRFHELLLKLEIYAITRLEIDKYVDVFRSLDIAPFCRCVSKGVYVLSTIPRLISFFYELHSNFIQCIKYNVSISVCLDGTVNENCPCNWILRLPSSKFVCTLWHISFFFFFL